MTSKKTVTVEIPVGELGPDGYAELWDLLKRHAPPGIDLDKLEHEGEGTILPIRINFVF